jgi:LysR family transcriptional regulator, regulator for metE and metH
MANIGLELRDLRMVAAIADAGTLTAAARSLRVSQPALSLRLRHLERRTGTVLYHRDGRALRPTSTGALLLEHARAVLEAVNGLERSIDSATSREAGRLRISTECYTTYRWLPRIVSNMRQQSAEPQIIIVAEATSDPIRALREERLDLAIVTEHEDLSGFAVWPLFEDELYAVMSARDTLAGRRALSPPDLAGRTLVLYTGDDHPIVRLFLTPAGVAAPPIVQVQLTEAIIELVRAGQGIACLAGWAFEALGDTRDLVRVRLGRHGVKRTWYAVTRDVPLPKATRRFIRELKRIGPRATLIGGNGRLRSGG